MNISVQALNLNTQHSTITIHEYSNYEMLLYFFLVYIVAIVVHEIGHWIVLQQYKPGAKILFYKSSGGLKLQTGLPEDYVGLSSNQKIRVYVNGILCGCIPIILATFALESYILLLVPYFLGARKDIDLIFKNLRAPKTAMTAQQIIDGCK